MLRFSRDLATTHVPVILTALLLLAIGYLLGAIPSGYLAGRWLKGIDLRDCGSGSTGATNVLRNVGKGPALVVFLIDVGKGALAVLLAKSVGLSDWLQVLAGLAALAGHIWPVWLGWKGGKAVATGLGMFLGAGLAGGAGLLWPVHGRDLDLPDRVALQRGGRHRIAAVDADLRRQQRLRGGVVGGQPDGALAPSQQHRAAAGGHRTQDRAQNPLGSLLLPILHSPGVMLVCRRRQCQPHIEIRQISDGAQGSSSSNKPALLKVMPCCCNGAWRVGKSHADRRI